VANAVQANLLSAVIPDSIRDPAATPSPLNQVYNVAVGDRTTLNDLFFQLRDNLKAHGVSGTAQPVYRDFRAGDVRHSQADVTKASQLLGYAPTHPIQKGIAQAMPWYLIQSKI
jgi:UDP-N-acetylglucosamine 4-epimerase